MIQSLNPATGEVLRRFEPLAPEPLQQRLELAAQTARSYRRIGLDERVFWMRRLASLLETDSDELAATITTEMGKTFASAHAELAKCAGLCRFYAASAARFLAPEPVATEHGESFVQFDPLGVLLAIMPWNYPFWQVFRVLVPALMAGNVVLLKHALNVPQCALAIEALVRRAGFPRGCLQVLLLETDLVESVIAHPAVAAVTLTGSERAGQAVASQAGWYLKKSVLELGGSDPFIVLPSADLEAAVRAGVQSRCLANGQTCIAAKRFIVHSAVYEEFQARFVAAMYALRIGDPMHAATDLGPLATAAQRDHLLAQIEAAKNAGGIVLCGGHRLPGPGFFVQPAVIASVDPASAIAREEIFGPVAMLFRVDSLDAAIALANDTPFGLGASAWTHDPEERRRLTIELECGSVFFNLPVASDARLPFGGIKRSGYGRELGLAGIREFVNVRTVVAAAIASPLAAQPSLFEPSTPEPLPTPQWTPQPFVPPTPAVEPASSEPTSAWLQAHANTPAPEPEPTQAQPIAPTWLPSPPVEDSATPRDLPHRPPLSRNERRLEAMRTPLGLLEQPSAGETARNLRPIEDPRGEFRLPALPEEVIAALEPNAVQLHPVDDGQRHDPPAYSYLEKGTVLTPRPRRSLLNLRRFRD